MARSKDEKAAYNREYRRKNGDRLRAQRNEWYKKNKERLAQKRKDRERKDPDKFKEARKAWYDRNKARLAQQYRDNGVERNREYWRIRKYGLSQVEWDAIFASQGRCCAICGADNPRAKGNHWSTDHCHETGEVRGILCSPCNSGLGRFSDDIALLRKAVAYLDTPPAFAVRYE